MKHLSTFLLLILGLLTASGSPLTPQESLSRIGRSTAGARFSAAPLRLVYSDSAAATPAFYVFQRQTAESGYVIAGADDLSAPVLGYVEEGSFDYASLPEQMRWWLGEYSREVSWARSRQNDDTRTVGSPRPQRDEIASMVHARWDQSAPYNALCPTYNGQETATGCVATAMAQLMHYWQYPTKGNGSNSYTTRTLSLSQSCNFANTTFYWDKMPNILTSSWSSDQQLAVTTLMHACGVAVNMNYNTLTSAGSGAYDFDVMYGMINYFDYDPSVVMEYRDWYTLPEWEEMVYGSLAAGRPLYYSGSGSNGGHAFVVDGYKGDGYFHLNWGWSGVSNGFFLLSALNPTNLGIGGGGGGFNTGQGATINLRPKDANPVAAPYIFGTYDKFVYRLSNNQLSIDASGFNSALYNFGNTDIPQGYLAFRLTDPSTGTSVTSGYAGYSGSIPRGSGFSKYNVNLPSLAAGQYFITPILIVNGREYEIKVPFFLKDKYFVEVDSAGNKELYWYSEPDLTVETWELTTPVFYGNQFGVKATIRNNDDWDFRNNLYICWYDLSGNLLLNYEAMPVDIAGGDTYTMEMYIGLPSSTATVGPGKTYKLALCKETEDKAGYITRISEFATVNYQSAQPAIQLTCPGTMTVANANNVYASEVHITCPARAENGHYLESFNVFVLDGSTQKLYNTTPVLHIPQGETRTLDFCFPFDAGEKNHSYRAIINYVTGTPTTGYRNAYLAEAPFYIGTTGIEMLPADSGAFMLGIEGNQALVTAPDHITGLELYSLQGMRHEVPYSVDGNIATLDLSEVGKGIYLLRVSTATTTHTFRLMRP